MAISLKAARVNAGLTQKEAAKLLGVSPSTLMYYEQGKSYPTADKIKRIEDLYGVRFNDLIFLPAGTVKQ